MDAEKLLSILADGEFHSGEEVGVALGVSRAAVWKQLRKLEDLNLPLESVKGRGYRLKGGLELLSRDRLLSFMPAGEEGLLDQVTIFPLLDSTNAEAARQIALGAGRGYCCVAEQQSAGRGRRGRPWFSPFARNLYFSLVWEFHSGAAALEGLSLSVGLAVYRALSGLGVEGLALKWPNDVLLDGKKLAGVLLEMQGDPAGHCQVIIGIGVNLDLSGVDTSEISQPWADLSASQLSRNQVLAHLVSALHQIMLEFSGSGFAGLRGEWERCDVFAGRDVAVQLGEQWIRGVARGVESDGALVVETAKGRRVFHGGEVSLRSAPSG